MTKPRLSVQPVSTVALTLLVAVGVVGCHSKRHEMTAAPAPTITVAPTCQDAAKRYGDLLADSLADNPQNPLPPALRQKAKGPIADAVVRSCEEDRWSDLPLTCLASAFGKGSMAGVKLADAAHVCAGGAGRENQTKMDVRVAQAMASVRDGTTASAVAAPYVSTDGGYRVDFEGKAPVESMKDDPNGGVWHDANPGSGRFLQYTDYANAATADVEVRAFLPTRDASQIKRDERVTFRGLEGRDLEVSMRSGKVLWIRFLIDGRRVFKLGAVYDADKAGADAFMRSFERVEQKPAPRRASVHRVVAPRKRPPVMDLGQPL